VTLARDVQSAPLLIEISTLPESPETKIVPLMNERTGATARPANRIGAERLRAWDGMLLA